MRGRTHLTIGLLAAAGAVALRPDLTGYSLTGVVVAGVAALAPDLDEPNSRLGRDLSFDPRYFRFGLLLLGALVGAWAWYRLDLTLLARQQAALGALALGVAGAAFSSEKTGRRVMLAFTGVLLLGAALWVQWSWLAVLGVFVAGSPFLGHRTLTHTLWAAALWAWICQGAARTLHDPGIFWLGTLGYLSHLVADSLTKARVKWLAPLWSQPLGLPLLRTGSPRGNAVERIIIGLLLLAVALAWAARLLGRLA